MSVLTSGQAANGGSHGGSGLATLPETRQSGDRPDIARACYAAQPRGRIRDWAFVLWCVLVPAAVVLFEAATHFCARMFFNPLPTIWHCGLALMVPVANAVVWWVTGQEKPRRLRLLGLLNGAAIGVAIYYSVVFAPLLPLAVCALLLFGMGLLPMAPLFSLIGAVRCRRRLAAWSATAQRVQRPTGKVRPVPGLWAGLAAALAVLAALQVPAAVTHYALKQAASADPAERKAGLALLRRWGSHQAMAHACRQWDGFDLLGSPLSYLASDANPVSPAQARETFYRVTGRGYDSRSPEGRGRWSRWEEDWDRWDDEENELALRGGEEVGGLVKGLSLASSQMEGTVYGGAAAGYFEWTMEFRNDTDAPQEARARVALPAGGVVSRVTLWIDGEEREAAFGPRGLVRAAYEQVAVVQRRDPLLVTTTGRDAVQAQCFPVPPHGSMKVRIGVTAPLQLRSDGGRDGPVRETMALPALSERNFAIAAGGVHTVHIASATPLAATAPSLSAGAADGPRRPDQAYQLHGTVEPFRPEGPVLLSTEGRVPATLVAEDPFGAGDVGVAETAPATRPAGAARGLVQRLDRAADAVPSRLVLVVDASASMGPAISALCDELPNVPAAVDVCAIVAADDVLELAPAAGTTGGGAEVAAQLRRVPARGGQDAVPALSLAWEKARQAPGAVVLWVHGTQPVLLQPVDPNQPWARRGSGGPRLLELRASAGANKVAEALAGGGAWQAVPQAGGVREDLHELFAGWAEARPRLQLVRERYAREDAESAAAKAPLAEGQATQQADPVVARLVAQLWAADEARRMLDQQPPAVPGALPEPGTSTGPASAAAADLAVSHRVVTPVSGAVVLETKQQYEQAGLKPPEVQVVPLPPTVLLMLTAVPMVAVGYYLHRRQGRRAGRER